MFMAQQREACTDTARCPYFVSASRHFTVLFRILGLGRDCKKHSGISGSAAEPIIILHNKLLLQTTTVLFTTFALL